MPWISQFIPTEIKIIIANAIIPSTVSASSWSILNRPLIISLSHCTRVFIINVFLLQDNNRAKKSPTTLVGLDINILFHYKVLRDFSQILNLLKVLGVSGLRVFLPPLNSLTAQVVDFAAGVIVIGNVGYPVWNVPVT